MEGCLHLSSVDSFYNVHPHTTCATKIDTNYHTFGNEYLP